MTHSFPHIVIRASAGSGKTYQLTNRYLALLTAGVAPDKILAATFTRKAAGEIFDRIVLRLAQATSDDKHRRNLAKAIERPDLTADDCREMLIGLTRSLHRLRVGTLDSFFSKIAGSCTLELGLPLGWRIVEDLVDARLRDRAIADSLGGESMSLVRTLLHLLTKGDAIRTVSQLIRDTVRELYLVARETPPEVWKKVPRYKRLEPSELESVCERLARLSFPHQSAMKEIEKDCGFVASNEWHDFVRRGIAAKILDGDSNYRKKPIDDETRKVYDALLEHARSHLVNQLADQTTATYDLLDHFRKHYEALKTAQAALRFDDVAFALSRAKDPDEDRVTFRLDATIDHLLLDEFQDTSLAQWTVLRPIARRVAAANAGTSFFCVGDVKQAIYGWRGGLAELFDAVKQELNLQELPLDTSYRSSQPVIDVVNRIFTRLDQHKNLESYESAVRLWQARFREHTTVKADLPGYVTLETCDRLVGAEQEEVDANDVFLDFAAERIADSYRQCPGRTIGVLTRRNVTIGQLIYRLRHLGIPASEEGGNPLTDSCAVELILSLIRLADHPGDTAAAYHIARSPLEFRIDDIRRTAVLAAKLRRELLDEGYGRAIYRWSQLLAPWCDERDRSRLQQLVELAYAYQPQSTLRPGDFLQFVQNQKVSDPTTSAVRVMTVHQAKGLEFDIVFLPELDSNRGLMGQNPWVVTSRACLAGEIDCVSRYTNEHVQKLLPQSFREMFKAATITQISEALCVLYVGVTRAIHALHMLIRPPSEKGGLPKSLAGLLRAALCDESSPKDGILFEHGQPDWHVRSQKSEVRSQKEKLHAPRDESVSGDSASFPTNAFPHAEREGHKITLAPPPAERRRGLNRESPSRLEGGAAGRVRRALELIDPQRNLAMLRGTIIHAWFEQILWLDDAAPSDERLLATLAKVRGAELADDKLRRTWLKDFRQMLSAGDVPAALRRTSYEKWWDGLRRASKDGLESPSYKEVQLEVRNEWPFAVIDGGQLLNGRMDRVVFLSHGGQPLAADVLDYKTDAISDTPGERIEDRVEHYRPQVDAYRRTIAQQTGLPPSHVTAGLLFVGAGKLMRTNDE